MRVFVTGATGYLGSDIVRELASAGHEVVGLTRMAEKSSYIEELGGRPLVGELTSPRSFRTEAREADALVHVAVEESDRRAAVDRAAVEALLEAGREGRPSRFIYTSGCFVLGETGDEPVHEDASVEDAPEHVAWRPPHERRVLDAPGPGFTTAVIRPGMVYGGSEGAFAGLFASAREGGAAEFIGDGTNHWSPVYRGDVSRLYRLVLEGGSSGIFHAAEPAERVGRLAMAASEAAGAEGRTERVRLEEARSELGAFADAIAMNQVMGCRRAHELGWEPEHPRFVESTEAVYLEWAG